MSYPSNPYREGLLPFGIIGNFAVVMVMCTLPTLFLMATETIAPSFLLILPGLLACLLGPILYNGLPSSFEKSRKAISDFTTGGSIYLFKATLPLF